MELDGILGGRFLRPTFWKTETSYEDVETVYSKR